MAESLHLLSYVSRDSHAHHPSEFAYRRTSSSALSELCWGFTPRSICFAGIVYCLSCKETEVLAAQLSARGLPAAPYHAQMDTQLRLDVHREWAEGGPLPPAPPLPSCRQADHRIRGRPLPFACMFDSSQLSVHAPCDTRAATIRVQMYSRSHSHRASTLPRRGTAELPVEA